MIDSKLLLRGVSFVSQTNSGTFLQRIVKYKLEPLSWSILEGGMTCNIDINHGEDILDHICEQSSSEAFRGKCLGQ